MGTVSAFQATDEMAAFTKDARADYAIGEEILHRVYNELNERSIIDDENRGQRMFNAFVDTSVEDPAEAWKWRGTRSMARNKGIAMHANLTASYLLPLFMAQNEDDETDVDFSETMRDICEWMAAPSNSNYQQSFLQVVIGALTNPVTFLGAEYVEVMQTIKERAADGSYTTKEVLDEVLSGFNAPIYSSTQVLITNAYERNMQRQRRVIKRRDVEKQELEALYGHLENWAFVNPGTLSIYNDEEAKFYDVKDPNELSRTIVHEETVMSRRDDTQVCYVNGIPMVDGGLDECRITHRDNQDRPKYNVVPFGYSRIGEHFFYYKSMMNALGWDNALYDAQNEVFMNRAFLEAEMPVAISGSDDIDSDIIFPGSVVTMESAESKANPLLPNGNLNALGAAMDRTEKSMNDGSVNETISGQVPGGSPTAYSIAQAQANAKKLISAAAKSIAESVVAYGDLMKDIAINHLTAPQVEDLLGEGMKLKYRSFLIESKSGGGDTSAKSVRLDPSLIGSYMTPDEKKASEVKLAIDAGYPEDGKSIRLVNPELFAKFRFLTKVDFEEMFVKNQEYWQPVLLNLKQTLMADPTIDQTALSKRLMRSYFRTAGDELVRDAQPAPQQPAQPEQDQGAGANASFGGLVQGRALAGAATGAVQ